MKTCTVLHLVSTDGNYIWLREPAQAKAILTGDVPGAKYEVVANVRTDSLDTAFRMTNHIDRDWTTNPGVVTVGAGPFRSTSVGDIVIDPDGKRHLCASFGWKEVA